MKQNKIAITGGIGSGKSTVCKILEERGLCVISADKIAHELLNIGEVQEAISSVFGSEFVKAGIVDRKKLASHVFPSKERTETLNGIMHPQIRNRLKSQMDGLPIVFAEVPLLFESNMQDLFDSVWLVVADPKKRSERVAKRDGLQEKEIEQRMENQLSDEKKQKNSHTIIKNNGTLKNLEEVVLAKVREIDCGLVGE